MASHVKAAQASKRARQARNVDTSFWNIQHIEGISLARLQATRHKTWSGGKIPAADDPAKLSPAAMRQMVRSCLLVPFDDRPLEMHDDDCKLLLHRSTRFKKADELLPIISDCMQWFKKGSLVKSRKAAAGSSFESVVIGTSVTQGAKTDATTGRQIITVLATSRNHPELVDRISAAPPMAELYKWKKGAMRIHCNERYHYASMMDCKTEHDQFIFGFQAQLAINRPIGPSNTVQLELHVDPQNSIHNHCNIIPLGSIPWGTSWLLTPDFKRLTEVPAGVMLSIPSSTVPHGNIDLLDYFTVEELASKLNRTTGEIQTLVDQAKRQKSERWSLVFYTQGGHLRSIIGDRGADRQELGKKQSKRETVEKNDWIRSTASRNAAGRKCPGK